MAPDVDVFDSQQNLDKFGKTLVPILESMGIKAKPQVQEAYKIIKG